MKATRLDRHGARWTGKATDPELALFVTALAFGLAMLSLFAVLAFANVVPLGDVAPFFAMPVLLFVTSGFFMNWLAGEAHEAAISSLLSRASASICSMKSGFPSAVSTIRRPRASARALPARN
jgi:hypothetical protein